jgi:hypothetical protein
MCMVVLAKQVTIMPEHYHPEEPPPEDRATGLTGYAIAKYGLLLVITVIVLYFIAVYVLPLI